MWSNIFPYAYWTSYIFFCEVSFQIFHLFFNHVVKIKLKISNLENPQDTFIDLKDSQINITWVFNN